MNKPFPNQTRSTPASPVEGSFDFLIQQAVEKALLNVSEPLLESVVDRIITRKMTENKDEPLTIDQAAALIHKKKQTIYSYCSLGKIPFHKSGNHNIFFRSELVEWLKTN
jgi:excisionase family DNA binding protein